MSIIDMVKTAQNIPPQLSKIVCLGLEHFCHKEEQAKATGKAVDKMDNAQKLEFAKALVAAIRSAQGHSESEEGKLAQEELVQLFGKSILECPAVTSDSGLFFTLTGNGRQFRAWYGSFNGVSDEHFDSCGTGCVFTACAEDQNVLREWITPIIDGRCEWKSSSCSGTVWMGFSRRRW